MAIAPKRSPPSRPTRSDFPVRQTLTHEKPAGICPGQSKKVLAANRLIPSTTIPTRTSFQSTMEGLAPRSPIPGHGDRRRLGGRRAVRFFPARWQHGLRRVDFLKAVGPQWSERLVEHSKQLRKRTVGRGSIMLAISTRTPGPRSNLSGCQWGRARRSSLLREKNRASWWRSGRRFQQFLEIGRVGRPGRPVRLLERRRYVILFRQEDRQRGQLVPDRDAVRRRRFSSGPRDRQPR